MRSCAQREPQKQQEVGLLGKPVDRQCQEASRQMACPASLSLCPPRSLSKGMLRSGKQGCRPQTPKGLEDRKQNSTNGALDQNHHR